MTKKDDNTEDNKNQGTEQAPSTDTPNASTPETAADNTTDSYPVKSETRPMNKKEAEGKGGDDKAISAIDTEDTSHDSAKDATDTPAEAKDKPVTNQRNKRKANKPAAKPAPKNEPAKEEAVKPENLPAETEASVTEDKPEKAAQEKATAAPEPAMPAAAPEAPAAKPASNWSGKAALALSIVALGASGYLYWLSMQQTQSSVQQASTLTNEVNNTLKVAQGEIDRNLADLGRQLDSVRAQANADKVSTEELQLRLTRSMQQLTATQETNRTDWLLAEVEYLMRLANQRVLMEQTASGALSLLKSADEILRETDDVTIYEVRKALANDIAALEAVPKVDTEGVFLKLGAINKQVDDLRMVPEAEKRDLPDLIKEITPETVSESWAAPLQKSWNKAVDKFNSLIVIQHRDEKVEALLSPQDTFYLQQNLHLMLEQAQLALLQRKQTAYDAALDKASAWTTKFFNPKDATTQAVVRGIEELKAINVSPSIPDISGSLASLKGYVQTMAKLKQEKGES